jgi:hypothetical protein
MDKTKIALALVSLLGCVSFVGQQREAAVPRLVNFAGSLKDAAGKPPAGAQALMFSLYSDPDSRTPLWQETQSIEFDEQGRYTVQLGAATANGMPLDLFTSGKSLWLGVQPQAAGAVEQARVLLVSVPYAIKAGDANTLGGMPASAFLTRDSAALTGGSANGEAPASVASRRNVISASTPALSGAGTANYIPLWIDTGTLGNSLLYQSGNNVGVGTTSPLARLHLTTATTTGRALILQAQPSQTGNLQEWQDSAATVLGYVNKSGGA